MTFSGMTSCRLPRSRKPILREWKRRRCRRRYVEQADANCIPLSFLLYNNKKIDSFVYLLGQRFRNRCIDRCSASCTVGSSFHCLLIWVISKWVAMQHRKSRIKITFCIQFLSWDELVIRSLCKGLSIYSAVSMPKTVIIAEKRNYATVVNIYFA